MGYRAFAMRTPQRRFFAVMAALAVPLAVAQGATEVAELVLYAGPVLLVAGLLVCGRFVGEERIVERLQRRIPGGRLPRVRGVWPRLAVPPLASLLWHDPCSQRGPPAAIHAAALA